MFKVRHGVFETNSSSTHSISIDYSSQVYEPVIPSISEETKKSFIEIYAGEFGWDEYDYYDFYTKASYCLTYAQGNKKLKNMLINTIKEVCLCDEVRLIEDGGYIDHQSSDVCGDAFKSKATLKKFLFSTNSYLHTGNDHE